MASKQELETRIRELEHERDTLHGLLDEYGLRRVGAENPRIVYTVYGRVYAAMRLLDKTGHIARCEKCPGVLSVDGDGHWTNCPLVGAHVVTEVIADGK